MRERFTDQEWALVRHIPFDAFLFAAEADDKIDAKEVTAFRQTLDRAGEITDPLHREVALDLAAGGSDGFAAELRSSTRESLGSLTARIEGSKAFLQEKLTRDEYQGFLVSVLTSGLAVAAASARKKGFLHRKTAAQISDEETKGLAAFAVAWDLDPHVIRRALNP